MIESCRLRIRLRPRLMRSPAWMLTSRRHRPTWSRCRYWRHKNTDLFYLSHKSLYPIYTGFAPTVHFEYSRQNDFISTGSVGSGFCVGQPQALFASLLPKRRLFLMPTLTPSIIKNRQANFFVVHIYTFIQAERDRQRSIVSTEEKNAEELEMRSKS